jgi:hypothetical protein
VVSLVLKVVSGVDVFKLTNVGIQVLQKDVFELTFVLKILIKKKYKNRN